MGGACREGYALWKQPYNWRAVLRLQTWRHSWSRRLVLEDNVMPLVCAVMGHKPYNTSTIYEKPEHACHRCHCWLRSLDPTDWKPEPAVAAVLAQQSNAKLPTRYGCKQCHNDFSYTPLTISVPGIPARTYFFCSTACREEWSSGR